MEKHFFWAAATAFSVLVLTLGFGNCSQDSEALKAYKVCMAVKHEGGKVDCRDPWSRPPPVPEASPK